MERSFKRETAYKIKLSDLTNKTLIREDGFASYVKINNLNVSRVNVIATIIDKMDNDRIVTFSIDDGFGNTTVTYFDDLEYINSNFNIGDHIIVIGRVSDFNGIKINGEIIFKTNKEWAQLRKKELELQQNNSTDEFDSEFGPGNESIENKSPSNQNDNSTNQTAQEDVLDLTANTDSDEKIVSNPQKVWDIIKENDEGSGVPFDIIKEKLDLDDEKIEDNIQNLLREGEIYEIKAGFYKVLE